MPHPVVYRGDLIALVDEADNRRIPLLGGGECARLPQELTEVGWTVRWQRGPRVLDSPHLRPGTVIANFKLIGGKWKYPNEHGFHAGLFIRFAHRAIMANGLPCEFTMFDQWTTKQPGERGVAILTPAFKKANPWAATAANSAEEFYVVLVP